ncbi:MAG TPA: SGNH/GDSL hydrolase family protein [Chthoniobacteraceae bacterium]|nr:SGNH/GDSL hydrolase family protein [Chthoniobacteraceae bacterium]
MRPVFDEMVDFQLSFHGERRSLTGSQASHSSRKKPSFYCSMFLKRRFVFKFSILLPVLFPLFFSGSLKGGQPVTRVILFGGSDVITSYLPEDERYHHVAQRLLQASCPGGRFEVLNAGDNGEFIARYLISGAYEKMRSQVSGADIVVVRFGGNDEKRVDQQEFRKHLELFLDLLKADFPDAIQVLETSIYMDPNHYHFDRNQTLTGYWQQTRDVAKERALECNDVYAMMERETLKGNWDLRIRSAPKGQERVLDDRQDAGKENDLRWFSDIHPNAKGVRLAADSLIETLGRAVSRKWPKGGGKASREPRSSSYYISLLSFGPERLKALTPPPWRPTRNAIREEALDRLQKPVNPLNREPVIHADRAGE